MPQMSAFNWVTLLSMFIFSFLMMTSKVYNLHSPKMNFSTLCPSSLSSSKMWLW